MTKIFIIFLISFSAYGTDLDLFKQLSKPQEDLCSYPAHRQIDELSQIALKYKGHCKDYSQDTFFNAQMGCFKGIGKGTKHLASSFEEMLKFMLVKYPVYAFSNGAGKQLVKMVKGEFDPAEMVNQYANLNLLAQADIWNLSRKYLEQFKKFSVDFKNELMAQLKGFPCLSIEKQNEIICRGTMEVFLMVLSPEKFLKGAVWGQQTMGALRKFIADTEGINGIANLSLAERLEQAALALQETKNTKELMKLRNGTLVEEVLPNGEKIINYEYKVKGTDGKLHRVKREVAVDSNTGAVDGKKGIGKEVLAEIIKSQQGSGTAIFIDVNHLGKANYFSGNSAILGGTQGGDMYLAQVAEEVRKHLRPGDMLFKNGGDEFVVVFGSNNPKVVKEASQRIINSVDQNKEVRQLFKLQVTNIAEKYREVNKASAVADLSENVVKSLSSEELALAKNNFQKFKEEKLKEIKADLQDQASYRGSISIGASTIKHGDTVETALERAEEQAKQVKASYKAKYGHDVSKYNAEGVLDLGSRRYGPAEALEPD